MTAAWDVVSDTAAGGKDDWSVVGQDYNEGTHAKANASLARFVGDALKPAGQTILDVAQLHASIETALNVTTGMVLGFPTYLATVVATHPRGIGLDEPDADRIAKQLAEAVTYQPMSVTGQRLTAQTLYPLTKLTEASKVGGEKVADVTGSAMAGAFTEATIQMLPAPLLGSLGRRLAGKVATTDTIRDTARVLAKEDDPLYWRPVSKKLETVYEETGIDPQSVYEASQGDPTIVQDLASSNRSIPISISGPASALPSVEEAAALRTIAQRSAGDTETVEKYLSGGKLNADEQSAIGKMQQDISEVAANIADWQEPAGWSKMTEAQKNEELDKILGPDSRRAAGPAAASEGAGTAVAAAEVGPNGEARVAAAGRPAAGPGETEVDAGGKPPPRTPDEQEILARIKDEPVPKRGWSFTKLYTELVDRFNPIRQAEKQAGGREAFTEGVGPYEVTRLTAGIFGKGDQFLRHGVFDFDTYKTTGPSYEEALVPVKHDLDGFRAYMAARRAIELEGRGIESGFNVETARRVVEAGRDRFEEAFQARLKYRDGLVDYAVKAGLISEDAAAAMREANKAYVPFYRFFEDETRPSTGTQPRSPVKRIKGSEREILDPIASDIKDTFLFLSLAEKNATRQAFVNMGPDFAKPMKARMRPIEITDEEVNRALEAQGLDPNAEGFTAFRPQSYAAQSDQIVVFEAGKRKIYEVDPEVARAFNATDAGSASILASMLRGAASWLRAGVTLSPDFIMRNPVRDAISAFVYAGSHPIKTIKGAISLFKQDEAFQNWMKGGGANATMVSIDRAYIKHELFELGQETGFAGQAWNLVRSPLEALRLASEVLENVTRLGAVRDELLVAQTKAQIQALSLIAREGTVDFARHGADPFFYQWTRATAFMNPAIQGVDLMFRAMKENPQGTFAKAFAGITLPSLYLWWANHDDPRWKDIPNWQRDLYWIVFTKDHVFRIPKPFELGVLFGSMPERALDAYVDGKPDAFKDFAKTMTNVFGFNVVPTVTLPAVEHMANYSWFTDRPLIPSSMEKILPEYQYHPYTTEATKAIGQIVGTFPGMHDSSFASPIVIDNYIRSWTGTLGTYAVQIADAALRKTGVLPDQIQPARTLADIPALRAFVVRYPSASAQTIQDFYDRYDKSLKVSTTVSHLAAIGDVEAMAKEALRDPEMMVKLDSIRQALGEAQRLVQLVSKNEAIDANEKRQLIDVTYAQMILMARSGNEIMETVDKAFAQIKKQTAAEVTR